MNPLVIATSPLTNEIYVGRLKKNGTNWRKGKQKLTGMACNAVAEHVMANDGGIVVKVNGEDRYEIRVKRIDGK